MLRVTGVAMALGLFTLAGCGHSGYAVRSVPSIAADNVGKPVSRLQEVFGDPRKIDQTPTKWVYVWFLPQKPAGAPTGFHGCEMEVTVDARSQRVWSAGSAWRSARRQAPRHSICENRSILATIPGPKLLRFAYPETRRCISFRFCPSPSKPA